MTSSISLHDAHVLIHRISRFVQSQQIGSGAIPWFKHGKLDPWDHCEAIMALNITSDFDLAIKAFEWLEAQQNSDGSWYAKYLGDQSDKDLDRQKIETNFVAYPATALWHFYVCSQDKATLQRFYPMLARAINYVVQQQHAEGDIQWAVSAEETLPKDALVTACASILRSLECAVDIADVLQLDFSTWQSAHQKLAAALKNKPWRFDRTWESKERFSMDWFYPILSGVFTEQEAQLRLRQSWNKFIVSDIGCKCVSDEPWVTIAESCELVMALVAAGKRSEAEKIFKQLLKWQDEDGGFWTGYVYRDDAIWPAEKTSWTAAAVALAADALFHITPASTLFTTASGLYFSENT